MGVEDQDLVQTCGIYRKADPKIQKWTQEMNRADSVQEKANKAEFLLQEVQALIDCEKRGALTVCSGCEMINKIRKEIAQLVSKTRKLV